MKLNVQNILKTLGLVMMGVIVIMLVIISISSIHEIKRLNSTIDSLRISERFHKASAESHEIRAMHIQRQAEQYKKRADDLLDSISLAEKEANKWKNLYDNSIKVPVHFGSDAARDSAVAKLYPH